MDMKQKIFAVLVILITAFLCIKSSLNGGDFDIFLDAGLKIKNGENIYAPPYVRGLQYYYSPLFALILVPFTSSFIITESLWLLLCAFLTYRTWVLSEKYFTTTTLSSKQMNLWRFLSFFIALQFILYNIDWVQMTAFLLWSVFEAIHLFKNKRSITGALLLALAINIKLLPLVFIPYLLYRAYYKETIYICLFSVILIFLPSIFIGNEYNSFLLTEWWKVINPTNTEHLFETDPGTLSLVSLIPHLVYQNDMVNLAPDKVELLINGSRLLLVMITLLFLRTLPFKKENNALKSFWEIAYILLLIPLIFPHQQKYAFLFAIPLFIYLIYYFISTWHLPKTWTYKIVFALLILSSIVFSPLHGADIIGRPLYELSKEMRMLTICSLMLIPIALWCNPNKIEKTKI